MTDRAPVAPGRALGSRYELNEVLGRGAMGAVWSATDRETGETVAAKVLHEQYGSDVNVVTRFVQERSILLGLRHPHIVAVRDLVVEGSNLAIVMDLVRGSDVRHHLRSTGTLAPAEAVELMADLLDALAAAHAAGVVHRDVKPDNILLDVRESGTVAMLSDFGVARIAQESQVRMSGLLGTADYMAPETFLTNEVGAASDVYAAGITLYELLAGRTPYAGETAAANAFVVARHHANSLPPAIPGLPSGLADILDSLLVKEPRRRPTAKEAAAALRRVAPDLAGLAALAPLAAPESWESVAAPVEIGNGPLPASHAAPVDADGTMIGVARRRVTGGPLDGVVQAADPALLDAPATQLGGRLVGRERAVDLPEIAPSSVAPAAKKSPLVWVGVGVGAIALIVGGVVLAGRGGGSGGAAGGPVGSSAISVSGGDPVPYGSGLQLTRSATVEDRVVTVDLAWNNTNTVPMVGPFFETVPGFDGSCPLVHVSGATATSAVESGFTGICGKTLTLGPGEALEQGSPVHMSYTLPLPESVKDDEIQAAVAKMLASVADATSKALGAVPGTDVYALQRLSGIEVDVRQAAIRSTVDMSVYPVWGSAGVDRGHPLYDSSSPSQMPGFASQLPPLKLESSCDGIRKQPGQPGFFTVVATGVANCEITATIRDLSSSGAVVN